MKRLFQSDIGAASAVFIFFILGAFWAWGIMEIDQLLLRHALSIMTGLFVWFTALYVIHQVRRSS